MGVGCVGFDGKIMFQRVNMSWSTGWNFFDLVTCPSLRVISRAVLSVRVASLSRNLVFGLNTLGNRSKDRGIDDMLIWAAKMAFFDRYSNCLQKWSNPLSNPGSCFKVLSLYLDYRSCSLETGNSRGAVSRYRVSSTLQRLKPTRKLIRFYCRSTR